MKNPDARAAAVGEMHVAVQLREVAVRQGEASPEEVLTFVENMLLPSFGEFDDEQILEI